MHRLHALGLALLLAAAPIRADRAPLEPASTGGLASLDQALARLSTHRRLLILAAHPDDEDTRLLTYVSRGLGGEAAYMALTRGEGGQNLLGPELGVGLGLLRSRELLAARHVDGGRQFFSRAYDFGYTRSLDETFARWPKEVLLEDALAVVRRFKPQVLTTTFPPSAAAGHGQHWCSSVVAQELYARSQEGGSDAWPIRAFYRSGFFDPGAANVKFPLGLLEPFSGRSLLQIAFESRSQHRCQDMGLELPPGADEGSLVWVAGGAGASSDEVFAGVDTRLRAMAGSLPEGDLRRSVEARLDEVQALAEGARKRLDAVEPEAAVEPLLEIITRLRAIRDDLAGGDPGPRQVRELVDEKLSIAQEAAATAARLMLDAVTFQEAVVPGQTIEVRSIFWNAGAHATADVDVQAVSADGWTITASAPPPEDDRFFLGEVTDHRVLSITVPPDAPPSLPYFLRRPLAGDLYDWSDARPEERGEPFEAPPLALRFEFTLAGVPIAIEREVVYRYRDQARGEIRRPLRVVPRLEVTAEPELVVWPIGSRRQERLEVTVRSNVGEPLAARLEVAVPDGWPAVAPIEIAIAEPRGRRTVAVEVRAPEPLAAGRYRVETTAVDAQGARYAAAYPLVDYPHIRPTPTLRQAEIELGVLDLRLPAIQRLGYVRGASDRVPELLREVGLPVELLGPADLAEGDLSAYDAIVVGTRAYETDPALVEANPRLLDYVRGGGLMVVQYQQYQFVRGGFAPFPLEIRRPHDRVTDETAPVRLLEPGDPVFHVPNEIGPADWDGWVQERGLYFAGTWDDAYRPLLAMADPGQEELRGGLLVAELGRGRYVYTGLAFFRQLPAGVPGAYRLFANLLALAPERPR